MFKFSSEPEPSISSKEQKQNDKVQNDNVFHDDPWQTELLETLAMENSLRNDPEQLTDDKLISVSVSDKNYTVPVVKPVACVKLLAEPEAYKKLLSGTGSGLPFAFVHPRKFNKRFLHFTNNSLIFMNWDNVIAAGGCISNICNPNITDIKKAVTDVDLFIYGLTVEQAQQKILQIVKDIEEYYGSDSTVYVCYNTYTVNIIPRSKRQFKVQIILRLYKSKYEVLAGFDVDSCAVGYDGNNILWTQRSYNSFLSCLNVVDLSRRSPSYEHRLDKYRQRGFGIWIPFKHDHINNLYFMNNAVQGLERLLYITQFHNHRDMERFLYKMTRKRSLKLRKRLSPTSDYEAVEEMPTGNYKQDLSSIISKYNQRVPEEYRYTVSWGSSSFKKKLHNIKLMTENPGQQFTGSFHPITEGDWVKPKYENRDHLGRNKILLQVKSGDCCRMTTSEFEKFLVEHVYDQKNWDSSLFTFVEYYLMYGTNYEHLLKVWNNQDRIPRAKINLYWFKDPLVLAILCNRTQLVKYVYQNPGDNYKKKDFLERDLIPAAIYVDNVDICKTLVMRGVGHEDPYDIEYYVTKNFKEWINHCRANRIAKLYGINMSSSKKKSTFSYSSYCKENEITNQNDLLASIWNSNNILGVIKKLVADPTFFENITPNTLYIVYKWWCEQKKVSHSKVFVKAVLDQLILKFHCNLTEEQFKVDPKIQWWALVVEREESKYAKNSEKSSRVCLDFLQMLYRTLGEQVFTEKLEVPKNLTFALKTSVDTDMGRKLAKEQGIISAVLDPHSKVTAEQLFVLQLFYGNADKNDFNELGRMIKEKKIKLNIWLDEHDLYRSALFKIDSPALLGVLVKTESRDKFLDKYRDQLGQNLDSLYQSLKEKRINVRSDEIYKTYAEPMRFNKWQIECLDTGVVHLDLNDNDNDLDVEIEGSRENVLGQTAYDYLVYQIMEGFSALVYKWFNKKDQVVEMTPAETTKLDNLRGSLYDQQVDDWRQANLTRTKDAATPELKEILDKI